MPLTFKNFKAASRKRNLARFNLFRSDQDLSWIDNAPSDPQQFAAVTYSATPVFDATLGTVLTITLTGNVTSSSIAYGSAPPDGQQVYIRIVQDAVGGRTFTLPSDVLADSSFSIDTRANYASILPLEWNGAAWEFFADPFSFDTAGVGAGKDLFGSTSAMEIAVVTGTPDGETASFTLSPEPAGGQLVFVNGVYQHSGVDYTVSGDTLAFVPERIPATGASIRVLVW
jgi:hypothetical protein